MDQHNPYQAPSSNTELNTKSGTYQPKVFSTKGRIGRLRYLAYIWAGYLVVIPVALMGGIASISGDPSSSSLSGFMIFLLVIAYIVMIAFFIILAKRRLNDLDHSGWMALIMLVPLVNVIFGLYIIFAAGKPDHNRFGPPPTKNSLIVKIAGLAMPVIAIIGIVAAVALPAYSDYVTRAQEAAAQLDSR